MRCSPFFLLFCARQLVRLSTSSSLVGQRLTTTVHTVGPAWDGISAAADSLTGICYYARWLCVIVEPLSNVEDSDNDNKVFYW